MTTRIFILVILSLIAFQGRRCRKPPTPTLAWVGAKTYMPPGVTATVNGLGIDGPVDVLPAGTAAVTVSRTLANQGQTNLAAGYVVEETIERLTFVVSGSSTGFVPGGTITSLTQRGPALAPGASAPITFGPISLPGCGFFRETLKAPGGVTSVHIFAVSSPMSLSVISQPLGVQPVEKFHDVVNSLAFTVTFTPGPNPTTFDVFGPTRHPVVGSQGSTGRLNPAPGAGGLLVNDSTAQVVVTYSITGFKHNNAPCTDILSERLVESVNSGITAITTDRCVLQQAALPVNVIHPCR